MTTWRNAPAWWRLAVAFVAVVGACIAVAAPLAAVWVVATVSLLWMQEADRQGAEALRAELREAQADVESLRYTVDTAARLVASRQSELRRRLEARPAAPVVNLYPRLPRDGGEAS